MLSGDQPLCAIEGKGLGTSPYAQSRVRGWLARLPLLSLYSEIISPSYPG